MKEETRQIILAILGLLTVIAGGAWISKKINKRKSSTQKNIHITGNDNKVIGGNDNSVTK